MKFILCGLVLFIGAACNPSASPVETIASSETTIPVTEATVVTPDGVTLYYRIAGDGDETVIAPFALYHGDRLDGLANGRRVVTYDPRGRGRSQAAPLERVSLDYLLSDFDAVRESVGAEKVAIIGWSGAGMEMFVYALRNPDRVTRLIQLAPVAARIDPYGAMMMEDRDRRTDETARKAFRKRVAEGAFDGDPEAHCRALGKITGPPLFADPDDFFETPDVCHLANEYDENIGAYFGALFESIAGYDWRDSLDAVSTPRLVIHGEKDNTPLAGNQEWVQGQPNAQLLVIEDAGHWPHYEQSVETLEAIDTFLDGSWPDTAIEVNASKE